MFRFDDVRRTGVKMFEVDFTGGSMVRLVEFELFTMNRDLMGHSS